MIIRNQMPDTNLSTKDFYYDLPEELIAQTPADQRDHSRLLVIDRKQKSLEHKIFHDVIEYLNPGDTLVINNSKVIPARLLGKKCSKDAEVSVEFLLLRAVESDTWEVMVHPGRRLKPGTAAEFGNGILHADILETVDDGNRIVRFSYDHSTYQSIYAVLDEIGNMPLPPYIKQKPSDKNRYQTVYAQKEGSAAAPTAGLHFTVDLLNEIKEKGIQIAPVLLHVGLGTFRPVKEQQIKDHVMHTEYISVSQETADIVNETHKRGGRVIAVGTTSVRTLESASDDNGIVHPIQGDTGIFIYPGYRFKTIDGLITNFHLPESTLLMLVSAFAGKELVMNAYQEAIREKYRFFSFGDACLFL